MPAIRYARLKPNRRFDILEFGADQLKLVEPELYAREYMFHPTGELDPIALVDGMDNEGGE